MKSLPLVLLICGPLAFTAGCKKETGGQAVAAAEAWLKLVDDGQFDQSWDAASPMIQQSIGKPQWAQKLGAVQGMFGKRVSRKLISQTPHTSLPGAPDGKYVVILFSTSFAKKASAVETITPKLEADGTWKVSGYYIK